MKERALRRVLLGLAALVVPLGPAGADTVPKGLPPLAAPPPAQAALGRALFFERRMSVNGTLSCAMCHLPEQGFTANEIRTSVGMEGISLRRNAPTLLNVAYAGRLFVDGRAANLEQQALMPMLHPDELANPGLSALVARVASWPELRPLFQRAFGSPQPTARRIARALAAYERTLLAGDSRFDRWHYGGQVDALTAQERRGFELFLSQGCVACHPVGERDALFTDQGFHNVGVQARSDARRDLDVRVELVPGLSAVLSPAELRHIGVTDAPDLGRYEITGRKVDLRAFRTPSLRNVALTAPYMHDGSFDSLEEVVDHYIAGGSPSDPAQDRRIRPLSIGRDERDALVAFMRSLTTSHVPSSCAPPTECDVLSSCGHASAAR